jgi:hypothetical protein
VSSRRDEPRPCPSSSMGTRQLRAKKPRIENLRPRRQPAPLRLQSSKDASDKRTTKLGKGKHTTLLVLLVLLDVGLFQQRALAWKERLVKRARTAFSSSVSSPHLLPSNLPSSPFWNKTRQSCGATASEKESVPKVASGFSSLTFSRASYASEHESCFFI